MLGCKDCGSEAAELLGRCGRCVTRSEEGELLRPHVITRRSLGLPPHIPRGGTVTCRLCANSCAPREGERGYCGLRAVRGGRLAYIWGGGADAGLLHAYYDPLPTNCCASWFCGAEGGVNFAVFFYGCNFDCLFCQNAQHKHLEEGELVPVGEFAERALAPRVKCVCFFGGSPEPQLPFAIRASKELLRRAEASGREIRICWEWNGAGNPHLVRQAAELSLATRGIVKFDLKAWDDKLSLALCGVLTRPAFENFAMVAEEILPRADHPLLTATTLLVPGYVDEEEVGRIAGFIASLSPRIPYSLLIFYPAYCMSDLPVTSREQAIRCYRAAREAGLERVHVGNLHLLGLSTEAFLALAQG
ncbi:radical SAM protein [Candidatus Bipolaricaulota sp. J31]